MGRREFHYSIVLFSQLKHPQRYGWKRYLAREGGKKTQGAGAGAQGKLLNSVFEKTLMVYQRKEGCVALNHKSFSGLCQISSTLQALKRNKETLLFGFPFPRGWQKTERGTNKPENENKVRGRARLPGSRGAPRPRAPAAAAGCERIACNCSTTRTEHDHPTTQRKPNLGVRSARAPPRPHRKGKREPLLPSLAPFNSGLSGGDGGNVPQERGPTRRTVLGCSETGDTRR